MVAEGVELLGRRVEVELFELDELFERGACVGE